MYLKAISSGDAIPRADFDATIHSVFRSAVNLQLNSGDNLLTLVTSGEADLPQGIRVGTPDNFSFETFRTGEQAACRDNILSFGSLAIDLSDAKRWKCDLPSLCADMANPAMATAWRCAWDALNKRQVQSGAEIIAQEICHCEEGVPFDYAQGRFSDEAISSLDRELLQRHHSTTWTNISRKAGEAMRDLVNATQQHDLSLADSSIRALVGLGSGLTPSGDDLLVGYIAGLWCAVCDQSERARFVSNLGEAIIRHSSQTNDISRTYLYHASRGQVSSLLANLAKAICMGENSRAAVESAMQVGHTSGMDAVTGLLVGLAATSGTAAKKRLSGNCHD